MLRSFFSKKKDVLTGTPSVRRLKTYSAESGYVYQYYYEGRRPWRLRGEMGTEFVFTISADRKTWNPVSMLVADSAIRAWEASHQRELASNEQYAIAKMALFQAFDERPSPEQMKGEVRVSAPGVEAILETLGLE